jgi:hypothetical protein
VNGKAQIVVGCLFLFKLTICSHLSVLSLVIFVSHMIKQKELFGAFFVNEIAKAF